MGLNIKSILGVAAGKGGVGKSTVTVNLALALKNLGYSVGILDADIYGPSIKKMLPGEELPQQNADVPGRIKPAEAFGIKLISIAYFRKENEAAVVRAPLANSIISQFLNLVDWGELDFLLIDFPPGTGDIQLTVMQHGALSGAIIVTTPQEVALLDVRKAMQMFKDMRIPVLGIVENMSYFPLNGTNHYCFGQGGGKRLAEETGEAFLGEVPIDASLSLLADKGESIFSQPENKSAPIFTALAEKVGELSFGSKQGLAPKVIDHTEGRLLTIEWNDGTKTSHLIAKLQEYCPCVRCKDSSDRPVSPAVAIERVQHVGRYALKINFNSGCSQGIYPYTLLKSLSC